MSFSLVGRAVGAASLATARAGAPVWLARTNVEVIGQGDPLFILHGGPGMSFRYLFEHLKPLAEHRTLVFYDQIGCGGSKAELDEVSLEQMRIQLREVVEEYSKGGPYGLLAHSWASHLVVQHFKESEQVARLKELVLVSPSQWNKAKQEAAVGRLLAKAPADEMAQWEKWIAENTAESGRKLLQALTPYYTAKELAQPLDLPEYSMPLEQKLSGELGDYDEQAVLAEKAPEQTICVYGDEDFFWKGEEPPLPGDKCAKIEGVGHYPFAEAPEAFIEFVTKFLQGRS